MKIDERKPIILGKNTIALLQIFTKTDDPEDIGILSEISGSLNYRQIARQFISQFKDYLCHAQLVAFADEFRKHADKWTFEYSGRPTYEETTKYIDRLDANEIKS